jgi:ferredoxin
VIVSEPRPMGAILESLSGVGTAFIVACGGCPVGCKSGGPERIEELTRALAQAGIQITGNALIDFLCDKALVGTQLEYHLSALRQSEALLVVSCGIGVQATGNMIDLPVIPANDTLSAQGMQGLWPSEERCAGCGNCALDLTGGICPITSCSKSLLNGMCGGQKDGKCEVDKERDCGWYKIYHRLQDLGKLDNLRALSRTRDFRKMDIPGSQRKTTRWAIEETEVFEASQLVTSESGSATSVEGK